MAWEISKRFTVANQTWFLWVDRHCGDKPRWAITSAKDGVPCEPCSNGVESQNEAMQPLVETAARWIRSKRYQIFVVRDGHFETDGCWLYSDEDRWFTSFVEACEMADFLGGQYPDVDWVVADENGNEFYRVVANAC